MDAAICRADPLDALRGDLILDIPPTRPITVAPALPPLDIERSRRPLARFVALPGLAGHVGELGERDRQVAAVGGVGRLVVGQPLRDRQRLLVQLAGALALPRLAGQGRRAWPWAIRFAAPCLLTKLLVPLATRGYTRKASGSYLVFGANGQRSPTATCEMMPTPRKLSAAVVIQSSEVALIRVTPLA